MAFLVSEFLLVFNFVQIIIYVLTQYLYSTSDGSYFISSSSPGASVTDSSSFSSSSSQSKMHDSDSMSDSSCSTDHEISLGEHLK